MTDVIRRHVKPCEDPRTGKPFRCSDPDHPTPLPPEGRLVVWNRWWSRRVRDGSVTIVDEPPTESEAQTPRASRRRSGTAEE